MAHTIRVSIGQAAFEHGEIAVLSAPFLERSELRRSVERVIVPHRN
jgi:hypothetical protein